MVCVCLQALHVHGIWFCVCLQLLHTQSLWSVYVCSFCMYMVYSLCMFVDFAKCMVYGLCMFAAFFTYMFMVCVCLQLLHAHGIWFAYVCTDTAYHTILIFLEYNSK